MVMSGIGFHGEGGVLCWLTFVAFITLAGVEVL